MRRDGELVGKRKSRCLASSHEYIYLPYCLNSAREPKRTQRERGIMSGESDTQQIHLTEAKSVGTNTDVHSANLRTRTLHGNQIKVINIEVLMVALMERS
ncbi:hypothetical protein QQF64_031273 [Cirrhinus molitorella]|uniref:Uncharacterized protein n=1 Tax=Cirrhinus molitorella TaxID=172907 RepID=A0ABR3MWH0_9TELE